MIDDQIAFVLGGVWMLLLSGVYVIALISGSPPPRDPPDPPPPAPQGPYR